ncbi:MAG TPA: hypothetical protein VF634_04480 [Pyrinomonadaceae bacterium]|jgi:hypothetical protein
MAAGECLLIPTYLTGPKSQIYFMRRECFLCVGVALDAKFALACKAVDDAGAGVKSA